MCSLSCTLIRLYFWKGFNLVIPNVVVIVFKQKWILKFTQKGQLSHNLSHPQAILH